MTDDFTYKQYHLNSSEANEHVTSSSNAPSFEVLFALNRRFKPSTSICFNYVN